MASNLFNVSVETLTAFAATYWFHSTLLLGAAWLLLRTAKPDSHFVRERIWKFAAVTGLTTAAVQLATGLGISVFAEPDDSSESAHVFVPRIVNVGRSTETSNRTRSNLTHAEARQHLATSLQIVQDSLNDLGNGVPATLAASKLKDESTPSRESTSPPTMGANDPRSVASVTFLPLSEEAPSPTQKLAADNSSGVVSLDATAVSMADAACQRGRAVSSQIARFDSRNPRSHAEGSIAQVGPFRRARCLRIIPPDDSDSGPGGEAAKP